MHYPAGCPEERATSRPSAHANRPVWPSKIEGASDRAPGVTSGQQHLHDGKIERFDCYIMIKTMLGLMGVS